jgi:chitosanase
MLAVCENNQVTPDWTYASNINDNRGITFGAIGFTTGTYDGNVLIKYYTTLNPNNNLAKYIPALDAIDAGPHNNEVGGNPSVVGLDNFIADVNNCSDPLWAQAQLYEINSMYWTPTVAAWNAVGANNELTLAYLYNSNIRFGTDGMQAIINGATSACGGTPATGINENTYLTALIAQMDAQIIKEGWGDTDRSDGFKKLQAEGNVNLTTPFTFTEYGDSYIITGNLDLTVPVTPTPTPVPFPDPIVTPTPITPTPVVPIIPTIPITILPTTQPNTGQSLIGLLSQSATPNQAPTLINFLTRSK